jgi:hypothetical protein
MLRFFFFLPVLVLAAACSGSVEAPTGPTTSVPKERRIDSLSDAEIGQICADLGAYVDRELPDATAQAVSCASGATAAGAVAPDKRATCERTYDQCMTGTWTPERKCHLPDRAKKCSATVAEVLDCSREAMDQLKAIGAKGRAICGELESSSAPPIGAVSARCQEVARRCP